jgi:dienelactone hydrolase
VNFYPHALVRVWAAGALAVLLIISPVLIKLPRPTGSETIGTLEMHLVDQDRDDPEAEQPGPRELMISIWYPAVHRPDAPATPYLPERIASFYDQTTGELGIDAGEVDFEGIVSHAQTRAAVAAGEPRPVLIYSPGGGTPRALGTTLVEDLVSHGYLVVTVDSTYQAPVQFPDGRMRMPAQAPDLSLMLAERVRDIRFVLDQLELIKAGGNPDESDRALPAGLGEVLDLDRIGMFGHSIGGFATAETMQVDERIRAGANLDGSMMDKFRGAPGTEIDRPFLLMGAGVDGDSKRPHTHLGAPDWASYWKLLTGWRRDVYLAEGEHMSFSDLQSLVPAVGAQLDLDDEEMRAGLGSIDPVLSLKAQRTYLRAFFDEHLTGVDQPVFDAVPEDLPGVELIR